ncbi:MAG TPA: ParA family protein [Acidobacteriota bacterium]|nr:ParA family protein [Acidobacteriota bacterium]
MKTIVVAGEKGGVGKSTVTVLTADWLAYQGQSVKITDADVNETTRKWVDYCAELGRSVSSHQGDYHLIDTAGRTGSGVSFLRKADLILAPFQPLTADVDRLIDWFLMTNARIQRCVAFIPNRLRAAGLTIEQQQGLVQVQKLIESEGAGHLLPGLIERLAVYPPLLGGSAENFFAVSEPDPRKARSLVKAQAECDQLFREALALLTEEKVHA